MAARKTRLRKLSSAAAGLCAAATTLVFAAHQRRLELTRLQIRQLELAELAQRRRALAHQQRMHWELLAKAIDDPSLAAVIDTYDQSVPAAKRRQFLYANAWYTSVFHLYRVGSLDQQELYGRLRELFRSPLMCEYWEASKHQRASLKASSDEARIGRMVDGLLRDMDEADTEEWWVVGNPPVD
ncbi:DUF6082 family protein [Streptomyces spongiae]|uniref:Uncharacterized protein n=1 Tax=Streptomyces spongiae TaxID=565072 RepID=A0A5N8XAH1_9ACTN|nr:DUF6082 family protein [Streptomyces spongiae]MPY56469.1 hypothetical protein [Streptomyces spongiae]